MIEFPELTIVLCTYNRYDEIRLTVQALIERLIYPQDKVRLLIADDHSPDSYTTRLRRLKDFRYWDTAFAVTEENGGWGVNVNNALRHVATDYVFFIEDDYVLTQSLDLRLGVALLAEKHHLGMVRYRGTAGDHIVFHQFECDIRKYIPDFRESMGLPGKLCYLHLDGGSPSLYMYSHGAHLKHRRFHDFYGMYPEGKKLGETEEGFAHIVKGKMRDDPANAPGLVILPEWIPIHFDHIGQSYQHTEFDT